MYRFLLEPGRKGGWSGIAFVVVLLVSAGMISLPTAAEPGQRIVDFYSAHQVIIIWQQVVGAASLGPFIAFVAAIRHWARVNGRQPSRWLIPASVLVVVAELATNVVPLTIAFASRPSADVAGTLTRVEDIADSALFAAVALFVLSASTREASWVRAIAAVVALTSLARAVVSPLGLSALDVAAPMAFIGFVILLSIRMLTGRGPARSLATINP
jgi:dipeptide/tripeptide permease